MSIPGAVVTTIHATIAEGLSELSHSFQPESRADKRCLFPDALQWPLMMRPALLEKTAEEQQALINQMVEKPRRERQRRLLEQGLRAPDIVDVVKTYTATIEMMEQSLKRQEWLAGDQFSLADCAMAPYFQTIKQFGREIFFGSAPTVAK